MKKCWLLGFIFVLTVGTSAFAQSKEPPYNMDKLSAYSIFLENYNNENYNMALDYGRWMLYAKPTSIKGYKQFELSRNFDRMITVYEEIAKQKEDPTVRSTYLDSALTVFDMAFETFGEDLDQFKWKLKKARFYRRNAEYISDANEKAQQIFMELYKKDAEKFTKAGKGYYLQLVLQFLVSEDKKKEALDMIKKTEPYASEKLASYFDKIRDKLFDTPKQRIEFLKSELKEEPKNVKLLNELVKIYEEQEMYSEAKDIALRLYKINPTYENTVRLADIAISNANYKRSIKYLKEARGKTEESSKLKRISKQIAEAYLNLDQLKNARKYARQAIKYDKQSGEAYLMISKIYARAVSNCTSGRKMDRKDKVVYWLVLDYLDKARQVDETTTRTVEQRYKSYKPVTPSKEEKFFSNWETGDEIKVDKNLYKCYDWINETTEVR